MINVSMSKVESISLTINENYKGINYITICFKDGTEQKYYFDSREEAEKEYERLSKINSKHKRRMKKLQQNEELTQ